MERASRLGAIGGGFTALAAIVGYYVIPLVTGEADRSLESLATVGVETLGSSPVSYHFWVLVLPSFLVTIGAVLRHRHRGEHAREDDYRIIAGVILAPLVMAVVLYFLGALVVAGSFADGIVLSFFWEDSPAPGDPESILFFLLGILGLFLMLFLILALTLYVGGYGLVANVFPVFILAIGAGTVSGYIAVRILIRATSRNTSDVRD